MASSGQRAGFVAMLVTIAVLALFTIACLSYALSDRPPGL